ncbi:MAG: hypothetical protein AAB948_04030 [Patescibacteria group bacterium]
MGVMNLAAKTNRKMLIIKNGGGQNSLKRMIAFFGFLILSGGFVLMAYKGKLGSETFLTYPLGLIILYVPQLAINLLKIWKGQSNAEAE